MKFLTDSNVRYSLAELLRKLDHHVSLADEQGFLGEKDDSRLVVWARIHDHIFLTFDAMRGESGLEVAKEIRLNGGKVIYIAGGPAQAPERSLGKLYFHWEEWTRYFADEGGIVHLQDTGKPVRWYPRSNVQAFLHPKQVPPFERYVQQIEEAMKNRPLRGPRKRRRPKEQVALDETLGVNNG